MLLIDHTLRKPHANLAFDEAIIESADLHFDEALRLWEMPSTCVVMGRGSKDAEINLEACYEDRVPVLRRCSGGASIVAGPGCLMYSVLLSLIRRPNLRSVDIAHHWVMQRIKRALDTIVPNIELQGSCDLTLGDRKFSGNAMRYKRDWLLYHGTLLYRFPLDSISRYLAMPARQPTYRKARTHDNFLVNLECDPEPMRSALAKVWRADQEWKDHSQSEYILKTTQKLLETKYA